MVELLQDSDDAGSTGLALMSAHSTVAILIGLGLSDAEDEPGRWSYADSVLGNEGLVSVEEEESGPSRGEGFILLE